MNLTRQLAGRIAALSLPAVPASVLDHARLAILDALGCALAGSRESSSALVRELAEREGPGFAAGLWGCSERAGPLLAALANGVSAHGLDFDDTHQAVPIHPSAAVLPAVVAAAEARGSDMETLMLGYVAGAETAIRVGLALGRGHVRRGGHPTGTAGTFGAAAGAGRVLGLDEWELSHALGMAGTQAAGLMEATTGNMTKALNAGKAAMNGLLAALLAKAGYAGPTDILAAGGELTRALTEGFDPSPLCVDWSQGWETRNISIKLFACCSLAQAALEAARWVHDAYRIPVEAVESVTLEVNPRQAEIAGNPAPASGLEAKFSLPFCAALGLMGGGGGVADFSDSRARDPALRALMERVRLEVKPDIQEVSSRIFVRTASGDTVERYVPAARGNPGNPAGYEEVEAKFLSLAEPALGLAAAEVVEIVRRCERGCPVEKLSRALSASGFSPP